jgi:hypothetical protein
LTRVLERRESAREDGDEEKSDYERSWCHFSSTVW